MRASARRFAQRKLWLWLLGALGGSGLAYVLVFGLAAAVLGASFAGCEPGSEPALAASSGPTPSAYALASIPPERLRLYEQAGTRFDIDWSFLASIGAQECGNGDCAGTNSSGCAGPMQIAYVRGSPCSPGSGPTLWERFAVSAHPGQPPSVNDPADAIDTAARILRQDMGAPATGGSFAEYHEAACHYYGACADSSVSYADEVMARAVQYGFTGTGSPTPTSPPLAEPVSSGGCSASVFTPEAASSSQIVRVAESQVGQGEHPEGSNCTIYGPCEEWCSLFTAWVWQHAGVPLPGSTATYGYSGSLYTWAKEHGGRVLPPTATPAPGDAIFYGSGPSDSAHVGIVAKVLPDGEIVTVEGNYAGHVTRVGPFSPADPVGEAAPCMGMRSRPRPSRREGRDGTPTQDDGRQYSQPRERTQTAGEDPRPVRRRGRLGGGPADARPERARDRDGAVGVRDRARRRPRASAGRRRRSSTLTSSRRCGGWSAPRRARRTPPPARDWAALISRW